MFNMWRNWFIDPESGLPWATVILFPWLKYGMNMPLSGKVKVEIPPKIQKSIQETLKTRASVQKKTAATKTTVKPVAKVASVATKKKVADKVKLPINAPKNALMPVDATEKTAVKAKTVSKKAAVSKTTVSKSTNTSVPLNESKLELVVKNSKPKSQSQVKETLPLDLPVATPEKTVLSKKVVGKKVEFSNESEAVALATEKKFTPIHTENLPADVQNLITQTNPSSPKSQIREVIALLSKHDWVSSVALADKLQYKASQLETLHLTPMVNSGQLLLRYPQELNHPDQAYRTVDPVKK